jgi:hypothetical protein
MLASEPIRIHAKTQYLASDLFSRVVNKSPVRGTIRGMAIKGVVTYYAILDFIHRRCNDLSGTIDRRMVDGCLIAFSIDPHFAFCADPFSA